MSWRSAIFCSASSTSGWASDSVTAANRALTSARISSRVAGSAIRDQITDAHRVYPGDGVAPLRELLRDLRRSGFRGVLSLELFNRDYWQQDALTVARTGLDKMRAAVRSSLNA